MNRVIRVPTIGSARCPPRPHDSQSAAIFPQTPPWPSPAPRIGWIALSIGRHAQRSAKPIPRNRCSASAIRPICSADIGGEQSPPAPRLRPSSPRPGSRAWCSAPIQSPLLLKPDCIATHGEVARVPAPGAAKPSHLSRLAAMEHSTAQGTASTLYHRARWPTAVKPCIVSFAHLAATPARSAAAPAPWKSACRRSQLRLCNRRRAPVWLRTRSRSRIPTLPHPLDQQISPSAQLRICRSQS